ncbi:deoxyribodipyrimidine photo-lyase [Pseudomonas cuatrocienegasensis]|uniref:Cryptochrome DASH n=1 Tax=Pseudomonas cuatrocienegasensis TaxID=543360 RepID=A0ABY1BH88_9PSED|nr:MULTISPECIES: DASH family cryptochrome [Pseudomonas]OEC33340.1 DASH family cryptochrome [Pseudomonas sp. 21C1]SEQ86830.1 deoxyribodipyrimidine photo-lyase [Pseudomonas cuatrocienegasensis]
MRALLWFKNDLRLDDHPALQASLQAQCLLPVYVLDPALLQRGEFGSRRLGVHRARFLLESLAALDSALRRRGSHLLVLPGSAEKVIPELVEQLQLQQVFTLQEIAPDERALVTRVARRLGSTPLHQSADNSLLRAEDLPCTVAELPQVFTQFRNLVEERLQVFQPSVIPNSLPPLPANAEALLHPLPSLSQMGLGEPLSVAASAFPFAGGEPAALARLRDYLWSSQAVRQYKETRNGLIGSEYSSKFSPWLANGCLSARRVVAELRRHEAQFGRNDSTYWLWVEMLWRDFFRWTLVRHGSALFKAGGLKATERAPSAVDERFEQWCQGRTGMPLVDANMRELATTGFMSNRGRQIVASYLINDLQQDWRHGAAWFEEHLIDYDPASNWGNWAYLAGVGSDPRRNRIFNALRQAREYDPDAAYVSLWLPELHALPVHLRHTPFLLSRLQLDALHYPRLEQIPETWQPYLPQVA